jgi:hypothetical protein
MANCLFPVSGVRLDGRDPVVLRLDPRQDQRRTGGKSVPESRLEAHADDAPGRNLRVFACCDERINLGLPKNSASFSASLA